MGNYRKRGFTTQKICQCGEPVLGGSATKYCFDCKAEVKRIQNNSYYKKAKKK